MYNPRFLTSALVGVVSFTSRPLYPGTHWIGGWVDHRAGLDDVEKRKFLTLPGLEIRPLEGRRWNPTERSGVPKAGVVSPSIDRTGNSMAEACRYYGNCSARGLLTTLPLVCLAQWHLTRDGCQEISVTARVIFSVLLRRQSAYWSRLCKTGTPAKYWRRCISSRYLTVSLLIEQYHGQD
jgi:hypothetical protein